MAAVQNLSTSDGENTFFRLKRDAYDSITASQVAMSVLCRYDLKGRYANVADATKRQPIISVAGELVTLKKSVCIVCDVIEWSYSNQETSKTGEDNASMKNRRMRNEELEKLVEKLDPPNKSSRKGKEISENAQEEGSSRAKKLKLAVDNNNATKPLCIEVDDDQNDEENSDDLEDEEMSNNYENIPSINSPSPSDPTPISLPLARQSQGNANNTPLRNVSHIPNIVIPNNVFPLKTHDEDQRYKRLMAGFMKLDDLTLPISYGDPDLEANALS
ncbi:13423_t:CDS:2 [Racocetra fulgida]|uniref:13423_t:CDS:1 n=1 Tax=Racocetra fulgida TaxID=60492 RepID=A0A9N8WFC8_9GLOM|nr:13423_t:CDS:2 [Racocetra fulgida]